MFWLKRQSNIERKLSHMHSLLARSFSNVKKDTHNVFQWLNYFYNKSIEQQNQIKHLQLELSYIPKKPEDIKRIIDSYYSFETVIEKIRAINEKIDGLSSKSEPLKQLQAHPGILDIEKRLSYLEEQKKETIREKVIQRVTRNSKDYVKNLILSYIRKYSQISGQQLKDIIVHDQGLCSKSSFYRLLEEIEALEEITTARKGKQKYYLYKEIKEN